MRARRDPSRLRESGMYVRPDDGLSRAVDVIQRLAAHSERPIAGGRLAGRLTGPAVPTVLERLPTRGLNVTSKLAPSDSARTAKWANGRRVYETQLSLSFFNSLSLSEHNQRKVEPMSTVTSADGTIIDYDAYGEGPTVILIGGATQHRAIDQRTTETAKQLAAEGFTAVDYDRRGRDRSGDTPPWSLAREVEDIAALIEATGAPAALYTSSSGATIALAAVTEGLDVSALALYEPPYFAGSDRTEQITTLERMLNAGKLDEATRYNMTALIGLPATAVEEIAQAPWWPGLVAVAPTLIYDHKALHDIETDPDWRSRWAAVTVPTVVYSGDQTFPGMPEAADAVAAALPNAQRQVLSGQDHGPAPEAIVPELVGFLRSIA